MNNYVLFLSTKGRKQFSVDFDYDYNDKCFVQKIINAVDEYCAVNNLVPDKSIKYKFVMQDENGLHLIAECNAVSFGVYRYVYEISEEKEDVYNVIYNHRYKAHGYYFWMDKDGLNVNLLDYEWNEVSGVELAEMRRNLANTKLLPCNKSKLQEVEKFFVYQVDKVKTCSVYTTILIKDPKIYKTIDDLWDDFEV